MGVVEHRIETEIETAIAQSAHATSAASRCSRSSSPRSFPPRCASAIRDVKCVRPSTRMVSPRRPYEMDDPRERPTTPEEVRRRGLEYRRHFGAFQNALDLYRAHGMAVELNELADDAWDGRGTRDLPRSACRRRKRTPTPTLREDLGWLQPQPTVDRRIPAHSGKTSRRDVTVCPLLSAEYTYGDSAAGGPGFFDPFAFQRVSRKARSVVAYSLFGKRARAARHTANATSSSRRFQKSPPRSNHAFA